MRPGKECLAGAFLSPSSLPRAYPWDYGALRHIYQHYGMTGHMKARLAFHDKRVLPDGSIVEMKIWEVSQSVPGSKHRLKYSLFYGRPGQRLIGYDNERGRGDYRHSEGKEQPYTF